MDGYRFYVREFLNLPGHGSSAHIIASISDGGSIVLEIADCDRKISLDFCLDAGDRENTFRKLDLLIGTLENFRTALIGLREEGDRKEENADLTGGSPEPVDGRV